MGRSSFAEALSIFGAHYALCGCVSIEPAEQALGKTQLLVSAFARQCESPGLLALFERVGFSRQSFNVSTHQSQTRMRHLSTS